MKKIKINYSKKEAQDLIKKFNGLLRPDLRSSENDPFEYYELDDKRILLVLGYGTGVGTLYKSEEDLLVRKKRADILKKTSPKHVLSDFPINENFPSEVDALIEKLSTILDIKYSELDKSFNSLKLIDRKLKKIDPQFIKNELYVALIAYTGKVLIKELSGHWEMKKSEDVWEPWILGKDGEYFSTFIHISDAFIEGEDISTYSLVQAEISRNMFLRKYFTEKNPKAK